jgi:enoyl-CoA hydratase/carnithine racemase
MAGTPILASLVRDDILRELTYTGRIFSAQEALGYGLATRVCDDPRAAAFEVARRSTSFLANVLHVRSDDLPSRALSSIS